MTARISLILGKARGHCLRLRAIALALRRPHLQLLDFSFPQPANLASLGPPASLGGEFDQKIKPRPTITDRPAAAPVGLPKSGDVITPL